LYKTQETNTKFTRIEFRLYDACAIVSGMKNYEHEPEHYTWINNLKKRGMGGVLRAALNALEPLGPMGAQMVYILQPAMGLFGGWSAAGDIAKALETPGGLDTLRHLLDEEK
jgi:hypothetical protein